MNIECEDGAIAELNFTASMERIGKVKGAALICFLLCLAHRESHPRKKHQHADATVKNKIEAKS
jgi:hypothetical protein